MEDGLQVCLAHIPRPRLEGLDTLGQVLGQGHVGQNL